MIGSDQPSSRSGCAVGDEVVILDRAKSRYFMTVADVVLPPPPYPPSPPGRRLIWSWADDTAVSPSTAQETWVCEARCVIDGSGYSASWLTLLRLRWLERRYEVTLRRGLATGLAMLARAVPSDRPTHGVETVIGSAIRARLLWTATNRCLPRSMAIVHLLRSSGGKAELVLGVALHPFVAHAWVQDDEVVLNDALDHVALFSPIFVA